MTGGPRLVGLRALKLGDFCAAVPAWKALRSAFGDHRTVLAGPCWQRPLVDLCPAIDELAATDELAALPAAAVGAEVAVNLHGRGPESTRLLAAAHPGRLVAFAHPELPSTAGGPPWDDDEHEVARWCRLVASMGAVPDASDLALERPVQGTPVDRATVLHAGASSPARCWPVERWIALAAALRARGHRVVLTGTSGEAAVARRIAEGADLRRSSVRAGRTDLGQLAALVADARLVVSGDTGVAHLASAYASPSVVLFGPISPSTWGPPADGPHRALWAGRRGDPHGDVVDAGLLALGVDDVLAAVDELAVDAVRS